MKKQLLITLILMCCLLSGCIKMDNAVTLDSDGSGEFSLTVGILKDFLEQGGGFNESATEEFQEEGFETKSYEDDKYRGFVITKKFNSVEEYNDIINKVSESDEDTYFFKDVKLENTGNSIVAKGIVSMEDSGLDSGSDDIMGQMILDSFDISFSVKPSGKVLSHNATDVSNGIYTWKVDPIGTTEINFEMESANQSFPIWPIIAIVVVVAAGAILFFYKKPKQVN